MFEYDCISSQMNFNINISFDMEAEVNNNIMKIIFHYENI